jgi:hypothetical protein
MNFAGDSLIGWASSVRTSLPGAVWNLQLEVTPSGKKRTRLSPLDLAVWNMEVTSAAKRGSRSRVRLPRQNTCTWRLASCEELIGNNEE